MKTAEGWIGQTNVGAERDREGDVFNAERTKALEAIAEDAPSKVGVFRKAYGTNSLRKAITAKCLECAAFSTRDIRECASTICPLWNVRPYQVPRKSNSFENARAESGKAKEYSSEGQPSV